MESLEKEASAEASASAEKATVDTSVRRVYRLAEEAVQAVGGMEVAAGICGMDRGDLRRALDHKGRYLSVDHLLALAARAAKTNATLAAQLGAALVLPMGLVAKQRRRLTDKQRADALEAYVRRMPTGLQMIEQALGGIEPADEDE